MHTKYYILILTFFFSSIFGQLRLELKLVNSVANLTIYNDSKENYILPVDLLHFRPYEADCNNFSEQEAEFPGFGLMVNIIEEDNKKEDYAVGYSKIPENFDPLRDKVNIQRSGFKKKILKWAGKHKIKDYDLALINYTIMNNLIFLKAKEKISFNIKLDLYNITAQELIFYNYILEKSENYKLYVSLCEFKGIDKYLTFAQKEKLKKYKLFTDQLESNLIELKHDQN